MEKPIKFKIHTTLTYSVNSYAWPWHAPSSQAVEKATGQNRHLLAHVPTAFFILPNFN